MKIGGQNKNITPVFWRWGSWSGAVGEWQKLPNRKISFSFSLAPSSLTNDNNGGGLGSDFQKFALGKGRGRGNQKRP